MKTIDLNVDVGEGFAFDSNLLVFATSANVCCGAHAGSPELSQETVHLCREHSVRVGAHPGVPDRTTMGRGLLPAYEADLWHTLESSFRKQVELLVNLGAVFLKPHGELYNAAAQRPEVAELVAGLLEHFKIPLLGLRGTLHEEIAKQAGVDFLSEGFADRAYDEKGLLVPRSVPGAVISSPVSVVENALSLAQRVDSICIHGDTEGSLNLIRDVHNALESAGYAVTA